MGTHSIHKKTTTILINLYQKKGGKAVTRIGLAASIVALVLALPIFWSWLFPPTPYRLDVNNGVFQQKDPTAAVTQLYLPETPPPENKLSPFELLRWQQRLTGFVGRKAELHQLTAWAESEPPVSLMLISGGPGTGKTRLAVELAERLTEVGWNAGLFDLTMQLPLALEEKGNLLILDDPEVHSEQLYQLLRSTAKQRSPVPLRLLLVSRRPASAWRAELDKAGAVLSAELSLQPLFPTDSYTLFRTSRRNAARALKRTPPATIPRPTFKAWTAQNPELHRRPLYILAAAIDSLEEPGWQKRSGNEILQALVRREQSRLSRLAETRNWPEQSLIRLQTLATVAQGLDFDAIKTASRQQELELNLPKEGLIDALQGMGLLKEQRLPPIQPDTLAAAWIATTFQSRPDLVPHWLGAALEQSQTLSESFQQLGNLIFDIRHRVGGEWQEQWLIQMVAGNQKLCGKLEPVLMVNRLPYNLAPVAIHCINILLEQAKSKPEQARLFNNLSLRLTENGDRPSALQAIQQAVKIYEKLAQENPAAFSPSLALSLNNLSGSLSDTGDQVGALQAIQRAVEIYEQLARENSAAYDPELARGLNNLSVHLTNTGDRPGALQAVQRAVVIYEQLARENSAAYAPELAGGLNNLSKSLSENGDRAGALLAIRRAVKIREQLAEENFAAFSPSLALSLNNLSVHLADTGDRPGALQAVQRAVAIYEKLARENSAAYDPELARGLNNLSLHLADTGDRPGALQAVQRAVVIYEQLARENSAAYAPELAGGLNNLSKSLSENGDRAGALLAIRRAVKIREQLAEENFAAFSPSLALSLNNLSSSLSDTGDRDGALQAIRRTVEIYEQLAKDNFAAYAPMLARSLNNLSVHLANTGDHSGALQAIRRVVKIYEQLAKDNLVAYVPGLARSLNYLSIRLADIGDHVGTLQVIRRAVAICEQLAKENPLTYNPVLALSLNTLSMHLAGEGKTAEAITTLQRAIKLITPHAIDGTAYGNWLGIMKGYLKFYQTNVVQHHQVQGN